MPEPVAAGAPVETDALREALRRRLPEYMVPGRFVVLESLPHTPSGKVDRRALVAAGAGPSGEPRVGAYVAPRTPQEELLAGLVAEVLGRPGDAPVGVHDDFFALGGHSLLATRLVARIGRVLGVELPLKKLFEAPTVAALAAALEGRGEGPAVEPIPRLARGGEEGELPLSHAQERLWFLESLDPGSAAYHLPAAVRLRGELDAAALAWSFARVVARHEVLRTRFPVREGRPVPRVDPPAPVALPWVDLRRLAPEDRVVLAESLGRREALAPFDLAGRPPFRARALRLESEEHLLLVTFHHVAADGWSLGVLLEELGALYGAAAGDRPAARERTAPLPELPIQYADYAAWQRAWLEGAGAARQLAYWRHRLAGAPEGLELPTDRPRPAFQTYGGGEVRRVLPPETAGRLAELGRREGATLFMTLLAAFGLLLGRLAGQQELVVGSPIAGRRRGEVEGLIGIFLNTLALRLDLAGDPPFRRLLARVREETLAAYDHQDVPFEKLLQELQPHRDLARTPLFQVFFNLLNLPARSRELPGLSLELAQVPELPSKFDLTLYAQEGEAGLHLELVYNAHLFDRPRAEEMVGQLVGLLEQVVEEPEREAGAFSLLTPEARRRLPDPRAELPRRWSEPVHQGFFRQAERVLERVAVAAPGEAWSYAALAAASRRLAVALAAAGVERGQVVALLLPRSPALAAGVLGVLATGAAFLILDPALPPARLAALVRRARPRAWLAPAGAAPPAGELAAALPGLALEVELDAPAAARSEADPGAAGEAPRVEVGAGDLAYLAFTSGSTGEPKGILGAHGPLPHFLDWHAATFGLGEGERVSLLSGLGHDPLLRDLFTPLWLGATLVIPGAGELERPGRLVAWMARAGVTVVHLTPAMGQLLAGDGPSQLSPDLPRVASLSWLFFGGDVLTHALVARLREVAPRARVVSFYGTTETPQAMGWFPLPAGSGGPGEGEAPAGAAVPLGRGIDGVQLLVLSPRGALCGAGELGEIAVRTPYLALGYLGDEAATRERFLPNPATGRSDDRLYRTGDLGRYRLDGTVAFAGRADDQVEIRGLRVEPAEVEAALESHPAVRESAVVARTGAAGGTVLVAFAALRRGAEAGPRELREHLRGRLPEAMVPAAVHLLPALPRTASGKLDRRALRDAEAASRPALASSASSAPPRDPTEELLAAIWTQVLGLEAVGVHDDFFELGGHSLLAGRICARVAASFGVELPLRSLFEHPTVARLARAVAAARRRGLGGAVAGPIPRARGPERQQLSFAQSRLWFLDRLDPGSPAYNLPGAVRITGALQPAWLAASLAGVTARHEALRTTFPAVAGRPVARVRPVPAPKLPAVDLSRLPAPQAREAARGLAAAEARQPFDLAAGPLMRAVLLRLAPGDHLLATTLHHIVADGWSMGVLVGEVARLYRALAAGEEPALPELPVQYADYAAWQRSWLSGDVLAGHLNFWRRRLGSGLPPLELPTDRPRPPVQTFRGATLPVLLPEPLSAELTALARRREATPFMLLLAAFAGLLGRLAGQEELAVGSPVANRGRVEIEGLVGFFVNTLVLPVELAGDPTFGELLARMRETALAAYAHQELPFERLVEELAPQRDLARTPLFSVMLGLQSPAVEPLELPGLTFTPWPVDSGGAKLDLTVNLVQGPGGFAGTAEYNTDLFDRTTVTRLLGAFQRLLAGAVAAPERRLSALPLLSAAQRGQLLRELNDTGGAAAADGEGAADGETLPALVAAQAGRTPERAALLWRDEAWSYAGWLARCRALAGTLVGRGVGLEVRVAVGGRRRPALLGAVLAVLEAGGAYVPLDPAYPAERVAFMLADSGATVLLTDGELLAGWGAAFTGTELALEEAWEGAQAPPLGPGCGTRLRRGFPPARVRSPVGGPPRRPSTPRPSPGSASPGNLSNLLYTSGSTGRPKGVAIEHRSAVALVAWAREVFGGGELSGVLAATSLCFDLSVFELFVPWSAGGTVVLAESVLELAGLPQAARVRLVNTVPSAAAEVLRLGALPASARVINLAGEVLPRELVSALHQWGVERVYNLYGPSEDTTYSTWSLQRAEEAGIPPIGRPVAGTRGHVAGRWGELLPPGVPGELLLAGAGLARGYLGRPALTAERFLPDPWGDEPGGRLYRTGDRVRRRPDGELVYLGRLDTQVKLRGFRIELGEVEAALRQQPEVAEAVAGVVETPNGDRRLVAWLVLRQDRPSKLGASRRPSRGGGSAGRAGRGPGSESPTELMAKPVAAEAVETETLREALRRRLPEYMVPGSFLVLDALPHTPSGKVDRRALVAAGAGPGGEAGQQLQAPGAALPPRNRLELELVRLFSEVLGTEAVGAEADFFALGGHSLSAVRVVAEAEARLGQRLPVAALFQHPTPRSLAALLAAEGPAVAPSILVPVQPRGPQPALFCVHPAGGDALGFFPLARHLGTERPLYAFQSVGLEAVGLEAEGLGKETEPLAEIGAMARRYLEELRAVQPWGPYRLAGWSLGGLVAYEMACLLAEAGEGVALLALFDTGLPRREEMGPSRREATLLPRPEEGSEAAPPAGDPASWLAAMADYAGKLWGRELPLTREQLQGLPPDQQQRRFLDALAQAGLLPPEAGGPWLRRLLRVFQANVRAAESYRPRPYPGRLTLFQACQGRGAEEGEPAGAEPASGGWDGLAAQVEVIPVPGDHITLMAEPQVASLAAKLSRLLAS